VAGATPLPSYPTTDPGPSTTAWFTDRYAPAGFSNAGTLFGRTNVLDLSVSSADGLTSRPVPFNSTFYNTQGRKIDIDLAPPVSWIGSLYVPASWATTNPGDGALNRRSDMWATLHDAVDAAAYYPIIGFTNASADGTVGGTPRLRVYDSTNGVWIDLAQPVAFAGWNDFCVTFTGTTLEYRIGNTLVHTDSSVDIAVATTLADVMLQAYNFGSDFTANWSHVAAGQATCAQLRAEFPSLAPPAPAKPVPIGPLGTIGAALAIGLAALRRRRT
jgi:hypothetical protein